MAACGTTVSASWLEEVIQRRCAISTVRSFQLEHGLQLVNRQDLFLVIAPGKGKTTVMHAPMLAADERKESGIGIIIVPTKVLALQQEEVAVTRGLRAIAINEDTQREAHNKGRDLVKEVTSGDGIRLAIMSPQMLGSPHVQSVLREQTVRRSVRWFMVDEAHLVDEKSGEWLDIYSTIKNMRAVLSADTVWAAFTGTATRTRTLTLTANLGFRKGYYINARYSIDFPHIKIIPRFFQHSVSGSEFLDISFVVPPNTTCPQDIAVTLIFCETIELGHRVMSFLDSLIPETMKDRESIIKLYNSFLPAEYRKQVVQELREGTTLRVLVCTDTMTYGFDVHSISRAIILGLRPSIENLIQQLCRTGRNGSDVVAYTFAPAWVQDVPEALVDGKKAKQEAQRRSQLPRVTLQWYNPTANCCPRQAYIAYNEDALPACRGPCCSFHTPSPEESSDYAMVAKWVAHLASLTQARQAIPRSDGTHYALDATMKASLTRMLETWRDSQWREIRDPDGGPGSGVFLPGRLIARLVEKAHICTTRDRLHVVLGTWEFFDTHADVLVKFLSQCTSTFDELFEERKAQSQPEQHEVKRARSVL